MYVCMYVCMHDGTMRLGAPLHQGSPGRRRLLQVLRQHLPAARRYYFDIVVLINLY